MNRMREAREGKRVEFSQYHLSALTGISQKRISLLERNLMKPSMAELEKIAAVLECKPQEIFPDVEKENQQEIA